MSPKNSAFSAAVRLLTTRAMSRKELTEALHRREYSVSEIAAAIEQCEHFGYLDEKAYAAQLVRRYARKGYGKTAIIVRLRAKGLDTDHITEAMADFVISDSILDAFAVKSLHNDLSPASQHRAAAALIRRGYSYGDALDAIARVLRTMDIDADCRDSEEDFNGISDNQDDDFPDGAEYE